MGLSRRVAAGARTSAATSRSARRRLTPELLQRWIEFGAARASCAPRPTASRSPPTRARADLRPRRAAGLAALREAAHAALPVPRRRRARATTRTGLPLMRHARARLPATTRARSRATTSTSSGPTCSSRRCSRRARRRARSTCRAGRWIDLWRSVALGARRRAAAPARRGCCAGGRDGHVPAPARRAAAVRARRRRAAAAARRRATRSARTAGRGVVHLADRAGRPRLLAFPRGRSRRASTTTRAQRSHLRARIIVVVRIRAEMLARTRPAPYLEGS